MEHETQRRIFTRLMHDPRLTFNQLWDRQGESNAFAYHLRKLEEAGLIKKFGEEYGLTAQGRGQSAFLEGETGMRARFPTVAAMLLARRGEDLLCHQRLKEPFRGHWSIPGGKVSFGVNPEDTARMELFEETGLTAGELRLRALEHIKTLEGGELLHHHILYIFETWDPTGALQESVREGRNAWLSADEYRAAKRFPGEWLWQRLLPTRNFLIVDQVRVMSGGEFVEHRTERIQEFEPI